MAPVKSLEKSFTSALKHEILTGRTHTLLHTHIHSHIHSYPHLHIYSYILTHSYTHTLPLRHTHTHRFSHTDIHFHTYLHTHTHINSLLWLQPKLSSVLPCKGPECQTCDTLAQGSLDFSQALPPMPFSGPPLYA